MQVDNLYMGWYDTMRANTSLYGLIHGRADRYVTMRVDISLCMLVLTKWVEMSLCMVIRPHIGWYATMPVDTSLCGLIKNCACWYTAMWVSTLLCGLISYFRLIDCEFILPCKKCCCSIIVIMIFSLCTRHLFTIYPRIIVLLNSNLLGITLLTISSIFSRSFHAQTSD